MKKFILHWHSRFNRPNQEAQGNNIAHAIHLLSLPHREVAGIIAYEHDGVTTEIAGQSNCGCVYTAEDGMSCAHDLAAIGVVDLTPYGPNVRLSSAFDYMSAGDFDDDEDPLGFEPTDDELAAE